MKTFNEEEEVFNLQCEEIIQSLIYYEESYNNNLEFLKGAFYIQA